MLTHFEVSNYKLFKKAFALKSIPRILLIGGENNCGKSSLLEALFLAFDQLNPAMLLNHLQWRGLPGVDAKSLFELVYHNFELDKPIKFKYTLNKKKQEVIYTFRPATSLYIEDSSINIKKEFGALSNEREMLYNQIVITCRSKNKKDIKTRLIQTPTELQLEHEEGRQKGEELIRNFHQKTRIGFLSGAPSTPSTENTKKYSQLEKEKNTQDLLKALQILEPRLKSLSIIQMGSNSVIHGNIEELQYQIPLPLMGEGINRFMSILLAITNLKNGILLIDELENGFHYSVLPKIIEVITMAAQNNNTQIIATTHSRELQHATIKGLPEDLRDQFQYRRIEKDKEDFRVVDYDFEILKAALDINFETR